MPGIASADINFDAVGRTMPSGFGLYSAINGILRLLWILFIAFAVIMFIIAGFNFLAAQGEPGKVKDARNALIWGIVGVVVGVIAFSLPFILQTVVTS